MIPITVERLGKMYRVEDRGRAEPSRTGIRGALGRFGIGPSARRPQREIWALRDVSLSVEPGTILGVIGNNGAGKTTLLKILARVTLPTVGRALVRGRVVSLLGLGDGFQPELSARENIFLHAALYGIPEAEVRRSFDEIIDFAGLGEFVDSPVGKYSSGMYLRLAFSVAVNMRPDVILADEVLAVGDIEFQERCLQRVEQVGKEGVTVLFVSHDMEAIMRLCRRAIRLERGKLVDEGAPAEVVGRYEDGVRAGAPNWTIGRRSTSIEGINLRLRSSQGLEIDAPLDTDDFQISATFRTLVPGLQVRPNLSLSCGDVLVLRSRHPHAWTVEEPSVQTLSIKIPGRLLSDRFYMVKLRLEIVEGGEVVETSDFNRITFRVYGDVASGDHLADRAAQDKANRPGVIAPRLEWVLSEPAPSGGRAFVGA